MGSCWKVLEDNLFFWQQPGLFGDFQGSLWITTERDANQIWNRKHPLLTGAGQLGFCIPHYFETSLRKPSYMFQVVSTVPCFLNSSNDPQFQLFLSEFLLSTPSPLFLLTWSSCPCSQLPVPPQMYSISTSQGDLCVIPVPSSIPILCNLWSIAGFCHLFNR